jgi:hypothetical protein
MSAIHETATAYSVDQVKSRPETRDRWRRTLLASTAALSICVQNAAWATCSDGSTLPVSGFTIGVPPGPSVGANWSPNTFTLAAGSLFIPDTSVNEHNDPAQPLTGGGHNWVFDQSSSLCKDTDIGPTGSLATAWVIPPSTPTSCVILPIIKGGRVTNLGDIPYQGDVITPTCDPTKLSAPGFPNPANTYFNQLGCSISHGTATTPQTATSFLFVAGINGGLFSIQLDNVGSPIVGGDAGKTVRSLNYYAAIPEGQKLTNAAVSKDGQFAMVTSDKKSPTIYACLNPLGDPGDPTIPINVNFVTPQASTVHCMAVGSNNLAADLTTTFGPDNQPYFGGQHVGTNTVNSFNARPGGLSKSAWPNCIWQNNGSTSLADAFAHNRSNGCGNAQPNVGFPAAQIRQVGALISHGSYMYAGSTEGPVVQSKVTVDPLSGQSQYSTRTYFAGLVAITGLGVADELGSLMVFTDPATFAKQDIIWSLPLCEDLP